MRVGAVSMPKRSKKSGQIIKCPYCKEKLYRAYVKPKEVYCPHCKRWFKLSGEDKEW